MSSITLIFDLARECDVPAKHGDIPNDYMSADKEEDPYGLKQAGRL